MVMYPVPSLGHPLVMIISHRWGLVSINGEFKFIRK